MEDDMLELPLMPPKDSGTPSSSSQTEDSALDGKANAAPEKQGFRARMRQRMAVLTGKARTLWTFAKEAWDEHDFWVEALAVKGGASAVVIALAVGVGAVVSLPFVAAAAVIAGCGALLGLGIYGCAANGLRAWDSICDVYNRVMHKERKERPPRERKNVLEKLAESKFIKKASENKLVKKFFNSRAWKTTAKFTSQKDDALMHGMAVGGSIVTLALGATVLATQVMVLPILAVGSLFTWAVAEVVICAASGTYGMYLAGQSMLKKHREKKAQRTADQEHPLQLQLPLPMDKPALQGQGITHVFDEKAKIPGNDNAPELETLAIAAKKALPGPPKQ